MTPDWNKEQFLAYVLLYAAHADLQLSSEEEDYIKTKIGASDYEDIKVEFKKDTEKMRAEKIIAYSHGEDFDKEYAQIVRHELEDLFMADGHFDHWEKAIGRALTRLITF